MVGDRLWSLRAWARMTGNHALTEARTANHPYWSGSLHTSTWADLTHHVFIPHEDSVPTVAAVYLSHEGMLIVTGGDDATVRLWNPITGHQVSHPLTGHTDSVVAATTVPLPDGRVLIATGSLDATVRLWTPTTDRQLGNSSPTGAAR